MGYYAEVRRQAFEDERDFERQQRRIYEALAGRLYPGAERVIEEMKRKYPGKRKNNNPV